MKKAASLKVLSIFLSVGSLVSAFTAGVTTNNLFLALFLGGIVCGCSSDIIAAITDAGRQALADAEKEG